MLKSIILLLYLSASFAFAQQEDGVLWTGIKVNQEVSKKINFGFEKYLTDNLI